MSLLTEKPSEKKCNKTMLCLEMVAKTGCGYITLGDLRKVWDNQGIPGVDDGKLKCNGKHCAIMFSLQTNFAISGNLNGWSTNLSVQSVNGLMAV